MKKTLLSLLAISFLISFGATFAMAAPQTTCPVMGAEINKKLYEYHDGKKVYFCCSFCNGEFKKDPEKYLKKLEEMGQEPEIVVKKKKGNKK